MRRDYKRRLLYYIWVLRGKHLGIRVSVGLQLAHNLPTKNSYGLLHMGPIYITAVFYVYRANTYRPLYEQNSIKGEGKETLNLIF